MALVTTKEMFAKALRSDYAVGAFNVNNMEIIQGIVEAAQAERSELILEPANTLNRLICLNLLKPQLRTQALT